MGFIIFAIAYVIFVPVVLVVCLIPVMKERKLSNGIRNQDVFSQNYLFKVNFSKCDFLKRMNTKNGYDILEYTFDTDAMTITFLEYGGGADAVYRFGERIWQRMLYQITEKHVYPRQRCDALSND